ncbi:hypothetical protein [Caballeronia sp. GAWG1-1]|uniref:hypothetical protein n=1 Tax=Caballeronia sp. GAWG1-1 TaxID=2921742 RepID=UPI002028A5B5|nr:hypothetical protein [Caballeronia sp. GAWG1-1]
MHTELRTGSTPFLRQKLEILDWTDIDIKKESQREERRKDSVRYRTVEVLKDRYAYDVMVDDDRAGEAADIVGIALDDPIAPRSIAVDLGHYKYSAANTPGARIDDMYVVCGQAQRSDMWLHNEAETDRSFRSPSKA